MNKFFDTSGVCWTPVPFGRPGPAGALRRFLRLIRIMATSREPIVHARSDLPALAAALFRRGPFVYDMRSFYPEQRRSMGLLSPSGYAVLRLAAALIVARAAAIIVLADAAGDVLGKRYGISATNKTTTITTCTDLSTPLPRLEESDLGPMTAVFLGSLNDFYDQPTMLRFLVAIRELSPSLTWILRVLGPVHPERPLAKAADELSIASSSEVPTILHGTTIGLSICRTDAPVAAAGAMPTKIAEYLAAGVPVAVSPLLGDMPKLVEEYSCGVVVETGREREAAIAFLDLQKDPDLRARCRHAAEQRFDLDDGVAALRAVYERVTRESSGQTALPS